MYYTHLKKHNTEGNKQNNELHNEKNYINKKSNDTPER